MVRQSLVSHSLVVSYPARVVGQQIQNRGRWARVRGGHQPPSSTFRRDVVVDPAPRRALASSSAATCRKLRVPGGGHSARSYRGRARAPTPSIKTHGDIRRRHAHHRSVTCHFRDYVSQPTRGRVNRAGRSMCRGLLARGPCAHAVLATRAFRCLLRQAMHGTNL